MSSSTDRTPSSWLHWAPAGGHSSAGRASGWQPEGHGFESRWLHPRSVASRSRSQAPLELGDEGRELAFLVCELHLECGQLPLALLDFLPAELNVRVDLHL